MPGWQKPNLANRTLMPRDANTDLVGPHAIISKGWRSARQKKGATKGQVKMQARLQAGIRHRGWDLQFDRNILQANRQRDVDDVRSKVAAADISELQLQSLGPTIAVRDGQVVLQILQRLINNLSDYVHDGENR